MKKNLKCILTSLRFETHNNHENEFQSNFFNQKFTIKNNL